MRATTEEGQSTHELVQLRHDLRQYVAVGILLSQPSPEENLAPDVLERLERIQQVFSRMGELTAPPAPQSAPAWVVDVAQLVHDCVAFVKLTHDVGLELYGEQPVHALCEPVQTRRAIANVLDNAARAAGPSGTVRVRVENLPNEALVEVTDDGNGFGRIPSVSGQGMSIVHDAVQSCRGRLEIVSGPGPGTTVRLLLPSRIDGQEAS